MDQNQSPKRNAPLLQEAIDSLIQHFDHPESLSIEYTTSGRTKQTTFELETADENVTYKLVYDGTTDDVEPEFSRID